MARKKKTMSSGVGGQAVLEGVMMKNKEEYAIAVRKPDGEIEVEIDIYRGILPESKVKKLPFIRGVFNFIESMVLGMKTITYSASFYEDAEAEETAFDRTMNKVFKGRAEKVLMGITTVISIALAIAIFMLLPYYLSDLMRGYIRNHSLVIILEGAIRVAIFLIYVSAISLMKDIHRLYRYHGAEHKCINCIEKGRPLTVRDVMRSSRLHRRCGTSFMFFVIFISIIVFFFIRVQSPLPRVLLRIALMPVIAGISYEVIRWAGRSNNILVRILSAPGMLIQRLTTKEPDEQMVEVAMKAVEAVFDWKAYQKEVFGYDIDETWMSEEAGDESDSDADQDYAGEEPDNEYEGDSLEQDYAGEELDSEYEGDSPEQDYAGEEPDSEYEGDSPDRDYAGEESDTGYEEDSLGQDSVKEEPDSEYKEEGPDQE